MARLIVVTGIPASGKTTVAAALAQRCARGVVVDGDMIRAMVVSGYADMSREPSAEALTVPPRRAEPFRRGHS